MSNKPKDSRVRTVIYTLSDPDTNEVRYVGKTVKTFPQRLQDHLYSVKKEHNYRSNWIKSILSRGKRPVIQYLDECSWDCSQALEIYWISQFKTWGFRLVNLSQGGEGNLGLAPSQKNIDILRARSSKKVYQYDLAGNFIAEYSSCQEAANSLGIKSNSKIAACARGTRRMCLKFQWSYTKEDKIDKIRDSKRKGMKLSKAHRDIAVKTLKGYGETFY